MRHVQLSDLHKKNMEELKKSRGISDSSGAQNVSVLMNIIILKMHIKTFLLFTVGLFERERLIGLLFSSWDISYCIY